MIMCDIKKIARPVATQQKKTLDDIIKIAPTVEIYNQSMVQKHPVDLLKNNHFDSRSKTVRWAGGYTLPPLPDLNYSFIFENNGIQLKINRYISQIYFIYYRYSLTINKLYFLLTTAYNLSVFIISSL